MNMRFLTSVLVCNVIMAAPALAKDTAGSANAVSQTQAAETPAQKIAPNLPIPGPPLTAAPGMWGALAAVYDRNGDGSITLEEYLAPTTANFRAMDGNGDGMLTQSEVEAQEAMRTGKASAPVNAPAAKDEGKTAK